MGGTIRSSRLARYRGFTVVELIMAVVLLAIIAALAGSRFLDFGKETKDSAVRASLKLLRNGIANQGAQMRLRCNVTTNSWPPLANLNANDITHGGSPCTTTQITNSLDRRFIAEASLPANPWGASKSNAAVQCAGTGCTSRNTKCTTGAARDGTDDGWCYNANTGEIWANSALNDNAGAGTGNEYSY